MGHTAQGWRSDALVAAFHVVRKDWSEAKHPRGADGRWINALGAVKWRDRKTGLWKRGTVEKWDDDGDVTVKETDGSTSIHAAKKLYGAQNYVVKLPNSMTRAANPKGLHGSNPGSMMQEADGSTWYVKTPPSPAHTSNEIAGHKLYALAGVPVPTTAMSDDRTKFGSKIEEAEDWNSLSGTDLDEAKAAARKDFVVDAWLANWDAPANDNIRITAEGRALRVDTGGSLDYRARGSKRNLTPDVIELKTMRDPSMSQGASLYAGVTKEEEEDAVKRILGITPEAIKEAISEAGAPDRLADDMITRRAWLANHYGFELPEETTAGKLAILTAKVNATASPNLTTVVKKRSVSASPLAPNSPVWLKDKSKYKAKGDTWVINHVAADGKTVQLRSKIGSNVVDNVDINDFELLRDNYASLNSKYKGGEHVEIGDKVTTPKGEAATVTELFPMFAKVSIDGTNRTQTLAVKKMDLVQSAAKTDTVATTSNKLNTALYEGKEYDSRYSIFQTTHRANAERYIRGGQTTKKTFDLKDVHPTQDVDVSLGDGTGSGAKDLDPIVARINGADYLLDGHHRAMRSPDGNLTAHFVDFDKLGGGDDPSGKPFDFVQHDFKKNAFPEVFSLAHDANLAVFDPKHGDDTAMVVTPSGIVGPVKKDKLRDPSTVDVDAWKAAKAAASNAPVPVKKKSTKPQLSPIERRQQKIDNMTYADAKKLKPVQVSVKYPVGGGSSKVDVHPGERVVNADGHIFKVSTTEDKAYYLGRSKNSWNSSYGTGIGEVKSQNENATGEFLAVLSNTYVTDVKEMTKPEFVKAAELIAEKDTVDTVSRATKRSLSGQFDGGVSVETMKDNVEYRIGTIKTKLPNDVRDVLIANTQSGYNSNVESFDFATNQSQNRNSSYRGNVYERPTFLRIDDDFWYMGTHEKPSTPQKLTDEQRDYYFVADTSSYSNNKFWRHRRGPGFGSHADPTPSMDDSKKFTVENNHGQYTLDFSEILGGESGKSVDPAYKMHIIYNGSSNTKNYVATTLTGTTTVTPPKTRSAAAKPAIDTDKELEVGVVNPGFVNKHTEKKFSPSQALTYKIPTSAEAMHNGEYDDMFLKFSLHDKWESERQMYNQSDSKKAEDGSYHHDPFLYEFVKAHGGDAAVARLKKADFDAYVTKHNTTVLYRGIGDINGSKTAGREEFQRGVNYAGWGVYGNGTYTSPNRSTATGYGQGGTVTRLTHRPDANVTTSGEISEKLREDYQKISSDVEQDLMQLAGLHDLKTTGDTQALSRLDQKYARHSISTQLTSNINVNRGMLRGSAYLDPQKAKEAEDSLRRTTISNVEKADAFVEQFNATHSKSKAAIDKIEISGKSSVVNVSIADGSTKELYNLRFDATLGGHKVLTRMKEIKAVSTMSVMKHDPYSYGGNPEDNMTTDVSSTNVGQSMTPKGVADFVRLVDGVTIDLKAEYEKDEKDRSAEYKKIEPTMRKIARGQFIQDTTRYAFVKGYDGFVVDGVGHYIWSHRAALIMQDGNG